MNNWFETRINNISTFVLEKLLLKFENITFSFMHYIACCVYFFRILRILQDFCSWNTLNEFFYLFMISDVLAYILNPSNYWYNSTSSTSIRYKSVKVMMSGARNVYWRVLVIIHIFNFISTLYNYISSKVISSTFNGFWISSFVKFNRCVYISYVWKRGFTF